MLIRKQIQKDDEFWAKTHTKLVAEPGLELKFPNSQSSILSLYYTVFVKILKKKIKFQKIYNFNLLNNFNWKDNHAIWFHFFIDLFTGKYYFSSSENEYSECFMKFKYPVHASNFDCILKKNKLNLVFIQAYASFIQKNGLLTWILQGWSSMPVYYLRAIFYQSQRLDTAKA